MAHYDGMIHAMKDTGGCHGPVEVTTFGDPEPAYIRCAECQDCHDPTFCYKFLRDGTIDDQAALDNSPPLGVKSGGWQTFRSPSASSTYWRSAASIAAPPSGVLAGRSSPTSSIWEQIGELDAWFDSADIPAETLDWSRVTKGAEEAGEAIAALALLKGANPRKGQSDDAYEHLLLELADVAVTGLCAIQHFTKDSSATRAVLEQRLDALMARMEAHRGR